MDLASLPLLALRSILVQLDIQDLALLACVSKGAKDMANDEDVWRELFLRLNPSSPAAQQLAPAPEGWRHSVLYQVPKSTEPMGGSGGGLFDICETAYSQDLSSMRLQQRLTPSGPGKPTYSQRFPQLAAPVCSAVTCRCITSVSVWLRNGGIRALQLCFAAPRHEEGLHADQAWSRIVGASDKVRHPPLRTPLTAFPPTFKLELRHGEHITRAKVSEGSGHFAKLAVLGIEFGTSQGRVFNCGEFRANVERVCDFTFPQRLTSIWGRSGWIVDQLGFEYL